MSSFQWPPSGGGTGTTGIITQDRLAKWGSTTALASSQWKEDATNGNWLYQGTYKGTKSDNLIALNGSDTGIFLDPTFGRPTITIGGVIVAAFGGNPELYLYPDGSNTANGMGIRGNGTIEGFGTGPNNLTLSAPTGSAQTGFTASIASVGTLWSIVATVNTNATDPLNIFHSGNYGPLGGGGTAVGDDVDFLVINRGGSVNIGAAWAKGNSLTVRARPDWAPTTNGTTTANATTALTFSGSNLTNDIGLFDDVALSSAATTFKTVTAIASDTAMTVSAALGNGTSQTFIRRQAPFRCTDRSLNTSFVVTPNNDVAVGPAAALATNATAGFFWLPTCAGTPTGTPTGGGLGVCRAMVWDSTNHKLYVFDNATWNAMN